MYCYYFESYCHIIVLYDIEDLLCYEKYGLYRVFNDVQLFIQSSLLLLVFISVSELLTISNICRVQKHIINMTNLQMRQRDVGLSMMLWLQMIISVLRLLPFVMSKLETIMTSSGKKRIHYV